MSDDAEEEDGKPPFARRDPWYSYVIDGLCWCGEGIIWLIGGIFRLIGWLFLAAFEGCG